MIAALALALLAYFPHLHPAEARHYSTAIMEESYQVGVDPLTVAARAWCESGFRPLTLHAGTYGMMQTRRRLVTVREQVAEGARALGFWQEWHARGRCSQLPEHSSVAHYTWGWTVPLQHRHLTGRKMDRVYRLLERKVDQHLASTAQSPASL